MQRPYFISLLLIFLILIIPEHSQAYIGPGASSSALETTIIIFGVILLAIIALVWYPVKTLLAKKKEKNRNST